MQVVATFYLITLAIKSMVISGATWSEDVYVPPIPPVIGGNNSLIFDGVDDHAIKSVSLSGIQNQFSILTHFKTNNTSTNQIYFHGGGYKDVGLRMDYDLRLIIFILSFSLALVIKVMLITIYCYRCQGMAFCCGTYDGQKIKLYVDGKLSF